MRKTWIFILYLLPILGWTQFNLKVHVEDATDDYGLTGAQIGMGREWHATDIDGEVKLFKGDVTLVR